ncbi:MAG: zinc-dependent metalloprotease [Bacteroidia bacterium]
MKTKLLVLAAVLFFTGTNAWAQKRSATNSTPTTTNTKSNKRVVPRKTSTSLFTLYDNPLKNEVEKDIKNAVFLKLNVEALSELNAQKAASLTLSLPLSANSNATFYLHPVKLLSDDFSVINDKNETVPYTPGLYYQGTIAGNTPSLAAWSFFENSIITAFSWNNDNYNLGVWKHPSNTDNSIYILYRDGNVKFPRNFECQTKQVPGREDEQAKSLDNTNPTPQFTNCVKIYFECDYRMYQDNNNNTTNVANFVTGMFNVVQTIYTNENIGVEISQIFTWTNSDPYSSNTTSSGFLNDFQAYRTTYNGDLAHLLTTLPLNVGGVAYLDVLCSGNNPTNYKYGISNIDNNYSNYPTYTFTTECVTHELGHNLGSEHTHWCGWVGGAIDDCYTVEPDNNNNSCSPGPTPPSGGGTIMSYCHLTSTGISLTNGFGTQPGNKIRSKYNAATCLSACTPTDPVCANSTTISGCGSANAQTFNGGGTGSWNNSSASACGNLAPGSEKVYTFVAPSTGNYSIQVTAASGNVHYGWKTGACGPTGWTCIGNINASGQYGTMSWTAGTTYYIMLDDEDGTTGAHSFYINCPPPSGPCANVTTITGCGSANTQSYTGGGTGSWYTSTNTPCGYNAPGVEKIFSFVAPTTGTYSIQVVSATGYTDYLWQASSCSQTSWTCIDDIYQSGQYGTLNWTAGTTYYLLLDDEKYNNTNSSHTFYINCPADTTGQGGDPCASVIAITNCGTNGAQTFAGDTVGVWNSTVATVCGYSAPGKEQIYSFTAPTTGTYSVNISAATGYVDYFWRAGTCDSAGWTCIVDTNVTGQFGSLSWTAGTTYYILLDDEAVGGTASNHTFNIVCPNDTNSSSGSPCDNIIAISACGSGNTITFAGGTSGNWNDTVATVCGYAAPGAEQIYSFVPSVTGSYSVNITSATGYVDYFWKTGSCDSLSWTCIVDTNVTGQFGSMSWTAGTTYYILLDDEALSGASSHSFYITCADTNSSSDPCANAIAISNCGPGAAQTFTGGGTGQWNTSAANACNHLSPGIEQVYSFVAPSTGTYSINVTAASGYVGYQWKAASCSNTGWNCIGNINATGLYGSLSWTAGTTYYIVLDDENSTTGTHTFYIECVGGSNPCTNATAITSCGANSTQTYTGGGSGAWNTSSNTACGFAAPGAEAVYTFAPATSGTYSIQVTAASGKVDYLWKAASCTSAGWTCIDDVDAPGQYGNMTWNVGTTYYILLDDENSTTGTHSFYINCTNSPSGIEENTGATSVQIYPNPNTGSFTVSIAGNTQESIEIDVFNVLGEDVFKSKAENVNGAYSKEITLSTIAKGIYTVRVKTGSKLYHKKIIVE